MLGADDKKSGVSFQASVVSNFVINLGLIAMLNYL